MACLKLREVLPVSGEARGRPQAPGASSANIAPGGRCRCTNASRSGDSLYPCPLTDDTDRALGQLARIWSRPGETGL